MEQSRHVHAPPVYAGEGSALDRLRQQFADARFYQQHHPELWAASHAFALRAFHDPAIARLTAGKDAHWHADVAAILAEGVRTGVFRADLRPNTAADILLSFFRGAGLVALDAAAFQQACAEIERWLLAALPAPRPPLVDEPKE